jgi:hypothetical protein
MFLKNHNSTDRLSIWRNVRQNTYNSADDLVKEFADIKKVPRYLDYYTPNSWPDPFEIVSEGYLCQSGITILLTTTLINKGFITSSELTFPVISNNISGDDGLVLLDQELVYNFIPGKIVDWDYVQDNSTIYQVHKIDKETLSY